MSDFLTIKRQEIGARLDELRPLVEEYRQLEVAVAALDSAVNGGAGSTSATSATPARRRARRAPIRRQPSAGSSTASRPGRRRGSGTRAAQALALVQSQPGIAIPELATKMKIKQNYLYRVMPGLEKEGKVRREGRGWVSAA